MSALTRLRLGPRLAAGFGAVVLLLLVQSRQAVTELARMSSDLQSLVGRFRY